MGQPKAGVHGYRVQARRDGHAHAPSPTRSPWHMGVSPNSALCSQLSVHGSRGLTIPHPPHESHRTPPPPPAIIISRKHKTVHVATRPPPQGRRAAPRQQRRVPPYLFPGKRPPAFLSGDEFPRVGDVGAPRAAAGALATPKPDFPRIGLGDGGPPLPRRADDAFAETEQLSIADDMPSAPPSPPPCAFC